MNTRSVPFFVALSLISSGLVGYSMAANASETKEVTRTITVYSLSDNAPFEAKVKALCSDKAVKLSDKAKAVCASGEFPKLTKQMRFRNAGIGAEFNALAAQR